MMNAQINVVSVSQIMQFAKNTKAVRVPGQDVINIICSPVFFFAFVLFFFPHV